MNKSKSLINILLVENSRLYQEMISDSVNNLGYNIVSVVDNGKDALDIVAKNEIHVILMDIGLEGDMDGIETSNAINALYDIPVIYLTAHSNDKIMERAKITAPYSYLIKPVQQQILSINIEMALYNFKIEQKLKNAINEKDFLMQEMNHRIKNNLQIIISLVRMQNKSNNSTTLMEIEAQLHTISIIHELLYKSASYNEIKAADYLHSLAKIILKDFNHNHQIELVSTIDDTIYLTTDIIVPMGLILNETITNTIKYAFPDNNKGSFFINLNRKDGKINFSLGDNGEGMDKELFTKKSNSLGMKLITRLTSQIGGKLTYIIDNGVMYEIVLNEFP